MLPPDTVINENTSIKEAMRLIYKNDFSMVIIEDKDNKFLSLLTSGDIRRNIIKGIDILEPVKNIIKDDVLVIKENYLNDKKFIKDLTEKANKREAIYIPILSEDNKVKYIIPISDLLKKSEQGKNKLNILKRVLVVGGGGYLGLVLVNKLLEKGYYVKVLDTLLFGENYLPKTKNLEFLKGDMRDITTISKALKNVDATIHLAAIVGDQASKDLPEDTVEINYLATKTLAEACKYNQINRFIFASTCSVYGTGNKILDEDSDLNPLSLYARSKIMSEEGILGLVDKNFSPCILRMGTLYGYSKRMRFDLVLNILVAHALKKGKMTVNGGEQYRPLVHVEDAAESYIKCLEAPIYKIKAQIFNVGSNEQNYKIIDLAHEIKKVFPETNLEILQNNVDKRNYYVSFDKINKILDFKTERTISDAIYKIKEAFDKGVIRNYEEKKYYNS